jgi:hypothetical protein
MMKLAMAKDQGIQFWIVPIQIPKLAEMYRPVLHITFLALFVVAVGITHSRIANGLKNSCPISEFIF